MTPEQIRASLLTRPREASALTLAGESAGEPYSGRIGVAWAIRNRVDLDLNHDNRPDWWGEGYGQVCLKAGQFSCWSETDRKTRQFVPNTARLYALAERVLLNVLGPVDRALMDPLFAIADGVMSGAIADNTNGSTHYLTTALYQGPLEVLAKVAPWAIVNGARRPSCAVVAHHTFFKDVG